MNIHNRNKSVFNLFAGFLVLLQTGCTASDSGQILEASASMDFIVFGMGCFWGAEKRMSVLPGVVDVESGYANGEIVGDYREILAHERRLRMGLTTKRNHTEVVKVSFDTSKTDLASVLIGFWENHDPTQGDRQGNDVGSNYRSAIYTHEEQQLAVAKQTRAVYQKALELAGKGTITTEIAPLDSYYTAEEYHQDYLVKNPKGYCGLGGTGVRYPRTPARSVSQPKLIR